jgi:hypothetical protein
MIKELIKAKGWDVPILQRPMALHYSFTPLNATKIDQFVTDFR